MRAKSAFQRMMSTVNRKTLEHVFHTWRAHLQALRRSRRVLSQLVARLSSSKTRSVFAAWRQLFVRMVRGSSVYACCIVPPPTQPFLRTVAPWLRCWQCPLTGAAHALPMQAARRALVTRSTRAYEQHLLRRCIREWRRVRSRRARYEQLRRQRLRQLLRRLLRGWRGVVARSRRVAQLMRLAVSTSTASCFRRWRDAVAQARLHQSRRRSQAFVDRLVRRADAALVHRVWLALVEHTQRQRKHRRTLRRWLHTAVTAKLQRAWARWLRFAELQRAVSVHTFATADLEMSFRSQIDAIGEG